MVNLGSHTQKVPTCRGFGRICVIIFFQRRRLVALTTLVESFCFGFPGGRKGCVLTQRFHRIMMSQVIQLKTHSFHKFTLELAQNPPKKKN